MMRFTANSNDLSQILISKIKDKPDNEDKASRKKNPPKKMKRRFAYTSNLVSKDKRDGCCLSSLD